MSRRQLKFERKANAGLHSQPGSAMTKEGLCQSLVHRYSAKSQHLCNCSMPTAISKLSPTTFLLLKVKVTIGGLFGEGPECVCEAREG